MIKRIIVRLALTAILVLAFAVPAFAQGQVERGPAHAKSICSFSGLNDEFGIPGPEGTRAQSYGQLVKQGLKGTTDVPSPGIACNPNTGPSGPFPPD
jgi:hypothetical protein